LACDNVEGPYLLALVLRVPDGHPAETHALFNGVALDKTQAVQAILQIYTAIGETYQDADFEGDKTPKRSPLS
jgi:hypothetical protein